MLIDIAGIPRSIYYYYTKHRTDKDKYEKVKKEISVILRKTGADMVTDVSKRAS